MTININDNIIHLAAPDMDTATWMVSESYKEFGEDKNESPSDEVLFAFAQKVLDQAYKNELRPIVVTLMDGETVTFPIGCTSKILDSGALAISDGRGANLQDCFGVGAWKRARRNDETMFGPTTMREVSEVWEDNVGDSGYRAESAEWRKFAFALIGKRVNEAL